MVKNLSVMRETWVRSLGSIPGLGKSPGGGHGNPYGQRSLVGYSPWGCKELDTTEQLSTAQDTVLSTLVASPSFSSVQFSSSVVSDFLRPHESQHARPPSLSPTHVH